MTYKTLLQLPWLSSGVRVIATSKCEDSLKIRFKMLTTQQKREKSSNHNNMLYVVFYDLSDDISDFSYKPT